MSKWTDECTVRCPQCSGRCGKLATHVSAGPTATDRQHKCGNWDCRHVWPKVG